MSFRSTLSAQFVLCPPLDLPLRLNAENGCFGCPRTSPVDFDDQCCSDHFASVHPDGESGIHQVHEAVDLASTDGACVYAAYNGVVSQVGTNDLLIVHAGIHDGFATRYVHVTPLVSRTDTVVKGEPVALVQPHAAGDHLHFGLWHWVDDEPLAAPAPTTTIPIDPTRLLYHWERVHALDWATIGTLDEVLIPILDLALPDPQLIVEFQNAGIPQPVNPAITVLAAGCVWRITGDDLTLLLRHERGRITVFDERTGTQPVVFNQLDRVGMVRRWGSPTFVVESGGQSYGIPLHDVANDHLHGNGRPEDVLIDVLRQAYEQRSAVELDVRRSPFWAMDGSLDELQAVIEGVRIG